MNAANAVVITPAAQIVMVFQMEIMNLITAVLVTVTHLMTVHLIVMVNGVEKQ